MDIHIYAKDKILTYLQLTQFVNSWLKNPKIKHGCAFLF